MNQLNVNLRGRPPKPVRAEVVRELTPEDLQTLSEDRGVKPIAVRRLRDSHHTVARMIAQGISNADIGFATGYSQSRISILKGDPSFQELVEHYRGRLEETRNEVFAEGLAKVQALRDEFIDVLQERLEQEPDSFTIEHLIDGTKMSCDRTGVGPASKSTNLNINLDMAERMARGRARAYTRDTGAEGPHGHTRVVSPTLTEYHRIEHRKDESRDA